MIREDMRDWISGDKTGISISIASLGFRWAIIAHPENLSICILETIELRTRARYSLSISIFFCSLRNAPLRTALISSFTTKDIPIVPSFVKSISSFFGEYRSPYSIRSSEDIFFSILSIPSILTSATRIKGIPDSLYASAHGSTHF